MRLEQIPADVHDTVTRLAVMCFFLDFGREGLMNLSTEQLAELATAHNIDIEQLILALRWIGARTGLEAAALARYRDSHGRA